MAKLFQVIALFLCWATVLVAHIYDVYKYGNLPHGLRAAFLDYLRDYQPFILDYSWYPEGWGSASGYVHWPGGNMNVFLGDDKGRHPELRGFIERRMWGSLYMDAATWEFLKDIEKELKLIKPENEDSGWFRKELAQALSPQNRTHHTMPRLIRNVVDGLVRRSRNRNLATINWMHMAIRDIVERRYQAGRYDRSW